jgi:antitoxin component YwqK of YwqJK toxin-antitoxin module
MHIGCSWFSSQQTLGDIELIISYYPNGSIEYQSEYKNGTLHGVTKYWDESENLISEAIYSNGKLHGIWTSYFTDGSIKSKADYYYGHKHGKEEFYYNNGQLQSLTEYNEGEVIFGTIRWTKAGDLIP